MSQDSLLCLAHYNNWADAKLLTSLSFLTAEELRADRQGFFGSLWGVLNHRAVADLIWWNRLQGLPAPDLSLNSQLAENFDQLSAIFEERDAAWIGFVESIKDTSLKVSYKNMSGVEFHRPIVLLLSHIFNHATHHRGQAHHMLSMAGHEPPSLDLIYFLDQWLAD